MDRVAVAEKGAKVAELKRNPVLQDFIKELRERLFHDIEYTEDINRLKESQQMLKTLRTFEHLMDKYIESGKLAETEPFTPRQLEPIE